MTPLFATLLFVISGASAHEGYPIPPARAVLRVEPDRAVLDLRVDSIYFIEEVVGLHPMPPRDWPADALAKTEAYVNAHLKLEAGGKVLHGKLSAARYRQLPWEVTEEGTFFLRLEYPLFADASGDLVVTSRLYEEYRKEMEAEYPGGAPYKGDYRLLLEAPGRGKFELELAPGVPARLPLDRARRGRAAMNLEALLAGFAAAFAVAAAFPALLGLGLWAAGTEGGVPADHLIALAACVILGADTAIVTALPWASRTVWAGLLLSSAAAAFSRRGVGRDASALAFFCLGAAWGAEAAPVLPHAGRLASLAAAAGSAAGGLLLFEAARRLGLYERAQARLISESRAGELFAARARLAASALALIGGYGLWLNLHG